MYVLKERGFSLEEWRQMNEGDRQIELLYAQMENEHKQAIAPQKGGQNGRN